MSVKTSKKNLEYQATIYISAILIFLGLKPYFWWWTESFRLVQVFCGVLVGFLFYRYSRVDKRNNGLIFLFILMALIYTIRTTITSLISIIPLVFIPFASKEFVREVYNKFSFIYCIIIGLGLISWILFLLGAISPIGQIDPLNEIDFDYYNKYPLFMITNSVVDLNQRIRFEGPFDEPGVIGTVSALMLFIQRFNFKDWRTYILLISGLFSLSLFFNAIFFGVGLMYLTFTKRKAWAPFVFIGAILIFYNYTKDDIFFENEIWNRIEWDSQEKRFAGDDRSNYDAKKYYDQRKWTTDFWWGLDNFEPYARLARGDCSYRTVVMMNGMVFLLLYVLFFMIYSWKGRKSTSSFFIFALIFLLCIYQRPSLLSSAYMFIYTCLGRADYFELGNLKRKDNETIHDRRNDPYLQTV